MSDDYYVCTGCALLCDDIGVKVEEKKLIAVHAACRKGVAFMKGCSHPMEASVNGEKADVDSAIREASNILKNAENPLIFGHANSSNAAQLKAIELARKTNAYLDDTSSFCQGPLIEAIMGDKLKTCTLDDVRHKADVIIFWGSDPASAHPRHMSRYSYFPRGKERQRGWEEDRTAIAIDVRKSDTAEICGENKLYRIPVRGDAEFMDALVSALSGKVPKTSYDFDKKRLLELASIMKKAKFGVIFAGLGMVYSLEDNEPLYRLMEKLNSVSNFHVIPMSGHYNMVGFNKNLSGETGYINRVKFEGEEIKHGPEYSVVEALRKKDIDAALVIGADPYSSLPRSIVRHLDDVPLIVIDPCQTLTSTKADVTIPCGLVGVESGGTAVRMDGVVVELKQIVESDRLSDEDVMTKILEGL